ICRRARSATSSRPISRSSATASPTTRGGGRKRRKNNANARQPKGRSRNGGSAMQNGSRRSRKRPQKQNDRPEKQQNGLSANSKEPSSVCAKRRSRSQGSLRIRRVNNAT